MENKKCQICGEDLIPTPQIEDYLNCKFVIRIFKNWKLALIRDDIEYSCIQCNMAIEEEKNNRIYIEALKIANKYRRKK